MSRIHTLLRSLKRVAALTTLVATQAFTQSPIPSPALPPAQHYHAAQLALAHGDKSTAAFESRMFLTDALGAIAINDAHAGEYARAASAFEQALTFAPSSPVLLLEYAEAALRGGDLDTAKAVASMATRDYPGNAKGHMLLGQVLLKQEKNAEARAQFEQAAAMDPTFAAGYDIAVACLDLGDEKCADSASAKLRTTFGDSAAVELLLGEAYLNSDFQNRALTMINAAIAKDPRLPGAHYSLAAAYLATGGSVTAADSELKQEIAIAPDEAVAYAALGHLEQGQHQNAEAEENLQKAIALAPEDPDAYLYLGQLDQDAGRAPEAIAALRRSIVLTRDPARNNNQVQRAHYLLGRLLLQTGDATEGQKELAISQAMVRHSLGQARERLAAYYQQPDASTDGAAPAMADMQGADTTPAAREKAAALEKQLSEPIADTYNNLGVLAGSAGDDPSALSDFEHAAEWDAALPGLDANMGRAAFGAGRFADAIGPLTQDVAAHPQDATLRVELGISQSAAGKSAAAVTTLGPLVAQGTAPPQATFADAAALLQMHRAPEAVAALRTLVTREPQLPAAHRALGEALAASSQPGEAASELKTAIRLNPRDLRAYLALGRLAQSQGNTAAAIAAFQSAAALDPQDAEATQALAVLHQAAPQAGPR